MKTYMFEIRDSDGNDCTVFDALVTAETLEKASDRLWAYLREAYPDDESDGSYGTYHACNCACDHFVGNGQTPVVGICDDCQNGWECSHGGLMTNEDHGLRNGPMEFPTEREARDYHKTMTYYHSVIDLTEGA